MAGLVRAFAALFVCASLPAMAAAEDETGGACPIRDYDILESDSRTEDIGISSGTVFFPNDGGQAFFLRGGMRWGKPKGLFLLNISEDWKHFFAKTFRASASAQAYDTDKYWQRKGISADDHGRSYDDGTEYYDVDVSDISVPGARRGIIVARLEGGDGKGVIIASSDDGKHLIINERTYERRKILDNKKDKTPRDEVHSLWAGWMHVVSDITAPTGPPLIVSDGDIEKRNWGDSNISWSNFYEGRVAKLLSIDYDGGDRLHAVLNLHILFNLKEPYWPNKFKFFMHGAGKDKTLLILHRASRPDENGDWPLTLLAVRPEHEEALVWRHIVGRLVFEADVLASGRTAMPPLMIHDGALVLWEKPFYAWGAAGQAQLVHFPRITITPMPDGSVDLTYSDPADTCPLPEDPWAWLNTPNDQE